MNEDCMIFIGIYTNRKLKYKTKYLLRQTAGQNLTKI